MFDVSERRAVDCSLMLCCNVDFGKTLQVLTKLGEEIYIELSTKTNGVNRIVLSNGRVCPVRSCNLFVAKLSYGQSIAFVVLVYHLQSRVLSRMAAG